MTTVEWVQKRPYAAVSIIALLIVVVIILVALAIHYRNRWLHPSSFDTSAWKYGSVLDWGLGGGSSLTPAQMSVYTPQLGGNRSELSRMMMPKHKSGYHTGKAHTGKAHTKSSRDGTHPLAQLGSHRYGDTSSSSSSSSSVWSTCPSSGVFDPVTGVMSVDRSNIGQVWNPSAIAEAQALAQVGGFVDDPSGDEMAFQAAINSARDPNAGADTMNDKQLSSLMEGGRAP